MNMNEPVELVAIGVLAQQLQKPFRVIESAMIALNIAPSRINYVPHFNAEQVSRIEEWASDPSNMKKGPLTHNLSGLGFLPTAPDLPRR